MSNEIKFFRNNSKVISFKFKKTDGTNWNIPNGNVCKFTVKKSTADSDTNIVIQKEFIGNGSNSYEVFLSGEDTNINVGSYIYDVKDTTKNFTLIAPNKFTISEVSLIGSSTVGTQNEDTDIEVVVETGILNNDYAPLTNKPKINSVELNGNKTSSQLGLQKELTAGANISITDNGVISSVTGMTLQVVETLPEVGTENVFYLTNKQTGELGDFYDEYVWQINPNTQVGYYEKIGNNAIDVSGKLDKVTTTNKLYGTDGVGGQTTYDKSDFASASDLSGKLDKETTSWVGNAQRKLYGINREGEQVLLTASNAATQFDIPLYFNGRLLVSNVDSNEPTSVTNKSYVDTALSTKADASDIPTKTSDLTNDSGFLTSHQDISGKLDKVTTATPYKQVYVKNADGTQGMMDANTSGASGNTIPIYSAGSKLIVGTPTNNGHATTKLYVDNALSSKADVENWELIAENTDNINEVAYYYIDKDLNNQPFSLKKILLIEDDNYNRVSSSGSSIKLYFKINRPNTGNGFDTIANQQFAFNSANSHRFVLKAEWNSVLQTWQGFSSYNSNNTTNYSPYFFCNFNNGGASSTQYLSDLLNPCSSFCINFNPWSNTDKTGTMKWKLYGVRS